MCSTLCTAHSRQALALIAVCLVIFVDDKQKSATQSVVPAMAA